MPPHWVRSDACTKVTVADFGRLRSSQGLGRAGSQLAPRDERLLTQQGGALVLRGRQTVFRHNDSGILKFVGVKDLLAASRKPVALPAPAL